MKFSGLVFLTDIQQEMSSLPVGNWLTLLYEFSSKTEDFYLRIITGTGFNVLVLL